MFTPIREGNRGGRGLFSWEDVRAMSYRDRECYLGSTLSLGYLDKGGRWRKRDWWTKNESTEDRQVDNMDDVRKQDLDNIKQALGITEKKKTRQKNSLSDKDKIQMLKKEEKTDLGLRKEGLGFKPRVENEPEPQEKDSEERKSLYKTYKRHKKQRHDKF
jgi:hypothetical protein